MFAAHTLFHTGAAPVVASTVIPYSIPFIIPAPAGAHYTDDFNRSNAATLGGNWNTGSDVGVSLKVSSNVAIATASGSDGSNVYASPMLTGDNQITVVMKGTAPATDTVLIYARCNNSAGPSSSSQYVSLFMSQGDPWTITRYAADSGVSTGGGQSWADGDSIEFSCVGATLTVKRNGSTVLTTGGATDLAAGYIEIYYFANNAGTYGFDSFDAQDI